MHSFLLMKECGCCQTKKLTDNRTTVQIKEFIWMHSSKLHLMQSTVLNWYKKVAECLNRNLQSLCTNLTLFAQNGAPRICYSIMFTYFHDVTVEPNFFQCWRPSSNLLSHGSTQGRQAPCGFLGSAGTEFLGWSTSRVHIILVFQCWYLSMSHTSSFLEVLHLKDWCMKH